MASIVLHPRLKIVKWKTKVSNWKKPRIRRGFSCPRNAHFWSLQFELGWAGKYSVQYFPKRRDAVLFDRQGKARGV